MSLVVSHARLPLVSHVHLCKDHGVWEQGYYVQSRASLKPLNECSEAVLLTSAQNECLLFLLTPGVVKTCTTHHLFKVVWELSQTMFSQPAPLYKQCWHQPLVLLTRDVASFPCLPMFFNHPCFQRKAWSIYDDVLHGRSLKSPPTHWRNIKTILLSFALGHRRHTQSIKWHTYLMATVSYYLYHSGRHMAFQSLFCCFSTSVRVWTMTLCSMDRLLLLWC